MIVMKFGGSSVANAEKIRQVFEIVKGRLPRRPLVIASAFRGVTDELFKLGEEAVKGVAPGIDPIRKRHQDALREMGLDVDLLKIELSELEVLLKGISLVKELSPRSLDYVVSFGERLSTRFPHPGSQPRIANAGPGFARSSMVTAARRRHTAAVSPDRVPSKPVTGCTRVRSAGLGRSPYPMLPIRRSPMPGVPRTLAP